MATTLKKLITYEMAALSGAFFVLAGFQIVENNALLAVAYFGVAILYLVIAFLEMRK